MNAFHCSFVMCRSITGFVGFGAVGAGVVAVGAAAVAGVVAASARGWVSPCMVSRAAAPAISTSSVRNVHPG